MHSKREVAQKRQYWRLPSRHFFLFIIIDCGSPNIFYKFLVQVWTKITVQTPPSSSPDYRHGWVHIRIPFPPETGDFPRFPGSGKLPVSPLRRISFPGRGFTEVAFFHGDFVFFFRRVLDFFSTANVIFRDCFLSNCSFIRFKTVKKQQFFERKIFFEFPGSPSPTKSVPGRGISRLNFRFRGIHRPRLFRIPGRGNVTLVHIIFIC